jgi:hypothetical protein
MEKISVKREPRKNLTSIDRSIFYSQKTKEWTDAYLGDLRIMLDRYAKYNGGRQ